MRRTLPLLVLLLLALAPASAHAAGWFPSERVDGPGPVERLGGVALSREGGGGLVYVKGGATWLSRLARNGRWTAPEAIGGPGVTEAAVAAGEDGRLALAWIQNGTVVGATDKTPGIAVSAAGGAAGLVVDIGVNGVAYAVWQQAGDVRAARLKGEEWELVPAPLDIDPARSAGTGSSRPRVAVAADGSALVVWGELMPDGTTHVFARRIYGTALSAIPRDATLAGGGSADLPDVDIEYDRSYAWVVFRQVVAGQPRSVARRLRASTFEAPQMIDGGAPSGEPRVAINGSGEGLAATATTGGGVVGATLVDDAFPAAGPIGAGGLPQVAASERHDAAVVWQAGGAVRARLAPAKRPFGREAALSTPGLGAVPAGQVSVSSDRVGNVAVAMLQGAPGAYSVTVGWHDINPSRPVVSGTRSYGPRRPRISWNPGLEYVGRQTFRVMVDGREVGRTRKKRFRAPALRNGNRRLQIIAVDMRGQEMASRSWRMRVDARPPRLRVGTARSGRCLSVFASASDPRGGRGMDRVRVIWGDGSRSRGYTTRHCYRRGGRYEVKVDALDRAGNRTRRTITLRV